MAQRCQRVMYAVTVRAKIALQCARVLFRELSAGETV